MTVETIQPVGSVKGQAAVSNNSVSKKSQSSSFSFQNMMDNASFSIGVDKTRVKTKNMTDNVNMTASDSNDKMTSQKSEIAQIVKNQKNSSADDSSVADETLGKIEQIVKEKFDLTDDEYAQIMELLGFSTVDLLNTQNFAIFTSQVKGLSDALELLTNTEASELFVETAKEISEAIDFAAEQTGCEKEEFIAILQQLSQNQEAGVVSTEKAVMVQKEDAGANELHPENSKVDNASAEEIKVEVNVTKTAQEDSNDKQQNMNDEGAFNNHAMTHSQFTNELLSNISEQLQNVTEGFSYGVDTENVMKQIVDAVKVNINVDNTSMEMQLTPEHLGKLLLTVTAKAGVVTAEIAAQNEAVKNALESQIITLKENMNEQGLKVDAVEVTLASHGFEMGHNLENSNEEDFEHYRKSTRKKSISVDEATGEELTDEELIIQEMMRAKGNNVDYIA